jgi:hypothetical protein
MNFETQFHRTMKLYEKKLIYIKKNNFKILEFFEKIYF